MVARLTRTRGNKGELCAISLTDRAGRLEALSRVYLNGQPYQVERVWYHKEQPIFKFREVNSISDAEKLAGIEVCLPASERVKLEDGEYYFADLVGCSVIEATGGRRIGEVSGWQETSGPVLLEVTDGGGGEILIPFAGTILKKVDVYAREILVELPPGLLELNR